MDKDKILETFGSLSFEDWDAKIKYRGVDHKYPKQLEEAAQYYERKLPFIESQIEKKAHEMAGSEKLLVDTLTRLKEKYACVLKEKEFREEKKVSRELHGTEYYIDLTAGDDAHTGLSLAQAWRTLEKYCSVTVRSPGDIAWVRANTEEILDGSFYGSDEDGDQDNLIELRGCSAAAGEDPWSDSSDIRPKINLGGFSGQGFGIGMSGNFWRLYRFETLNGGSNFGAAFQFQYISVWVEDWVFHTGLAGGDWYGVGCQYGITTFTNCTFDNNGGTNCDLQNCIARFKDCIFNAGGTTPSLTGLRCLNSYAELDNCTFGVTTEHTQVDISMLGGRTGFVLLRNCKLSSTTDVVMNDTYPFSQKIQSEDHNQVKGAQKVWHDHYTLSRSPVTQLDSLDSILIAPNSFTGVNNPITLCDTPLKGDYQIWCPSSETTIAIKARETVAWAADPSATEFYFEASYLDEAATSAHRATQTSAQGLSGTTEISFTMTFTPTQAGWVYVTCYLKKYEASKCINVSVKPTVS